VADESPCLWVLAGTNGAGKSSIGGAMLRESGGDYYNPDEAARSIRARTPSIDPQEANSIAWTLGHRQLEKAIDERREYFFETTLGGNTIPAALERAIARGMDVRIWYAGLQSPEMHIARVRARVRAGGHDIPEDDIRRRFDSSRRNLIRLLPRLTELKILDNSAPDDPRRGRRPHPKLVLHWRTGRITGPRSLRRTPAWAKPIVAQALEHQR